MFFLFPAYAAFPIHERDKGGTAVSMVTDGVGTTLGSTA